MVCICSNYRAYIGKTAPYPWLAVDITLAMIGARSCQARYQQFVEGGVDADTQHFFEKKKQSPIYGRPAFIKKMEKHLSPNRETPELQRVRPPISISTLVKHTAVVFNLDKVRILNSSRDRGKYNTARGAAMYLCRKCAGHSLDDIAKYFGIASYGSASGQIHRFRQVLSNDKYVRHLVEQVEDKVK